MSKPSIKFIYSGQIRSEVQHLQRRPAQLQTFPGPFMQAQYGQPPPITKSHQTPYPPAPIIISSVDLNSRASLQLNRHRSTEHFPPLPRNSEEFQSTAPVLNTEDTNESEVQLIGQKQPALESKRASKAQGEQIVLKAPSYKFTPKREGELVVHSRKQYKKTFSVDKPLNSEIVLKSKKQPRNPDSQKEQLRSSNPVLLVETIKESEFHIEPKSSPLPPAKKQINFDEQQIKAPKYKYTPKPEGETAVNRKKQYVKTDNSEKYLYEGVKTHREKDFTSCFGCAQPKFKTYKSQDD